jgi:hypothetical protein
MTSEGSLSPPNNPLGKNDSACLPDKTVWAGLPDWQGGYDTLIINWNTKLIGKSYEKLE